MKKSLYSFLLRVFVSLLFIIILLYIMRDKYGQIAKVLKGTDLPLFSFSLFVFFLALAASVFRLKLIIATQGIPATFMEAFSLTLIGYFFNNFLPTSIGGDVVKAYYLSKKTTAKMGAFTSVFVDRAIGLFTMIFMAAVALLFAPYEIIDLRVRYMIYAITAASVILIIFLINRGFARRFSKFLVLVRPIEEKLKKAYSAIHGYRNHTMLMFQSTAISIVSQLLYFITIGIMAASIGLRIPTIDILLRMPIVSAMSLLPSINGLGLREGSMVLLFGQLVGKANAFAVSILLLLCLFIVSILGGAIYALSPQFRVNLKKEEAEEVFI